ncbi:MAG TPA: hypothetical protein DCQ98_14515 [Planctomycetaceae bacterium]|nr:hypothetical protein [Planctomycetaceae bacterium]
MAVLRIRRFETVGQRLEEILVRRLLLAFEFDRNATRLTNEPRNLVPSPGEFAPLDSPGRERSDRRGMIDPLLEALLRVIDRHRLLFQYSASSSAGM